MKITNKNIKVGYEKDLFNTKWSPCIYVGDHSQLVDVYYNGIEIGLMQETFKFRENVPKKDRKLLKPMIKKYLLECNSLYKKDKKEEKEEFSKRLWK